jgi:hypothetical protein
MNPRDFEVAHIAGVDLVERAATIGFVRSAAARETDPGAAVPATTQAVDLEAGGALRRLPQPFAHDHRQRYLETEMLIERTILMFVSRTRTSALATPRWRSHFSAACTIRRPIPLPRE